MNLHRPRSLLIDSGGGWFDSGLSPVAGVFGRPVHTLSFSRGKTQVYSGSKVHTISDDPLSTVEQLAADGYTALGYVSYDYLRYTMPEVALSMHGTNGTPPLVFFHFYGTNDFRITPWKEALAASVSSSEGLLAGPPFPNITREAYAQKIATIKEHIAEGDVYQVNLSRQFRFGPIGEPISWFADYYSAQPVPFAALIRFPGFEIISGSMELFLKRRGDRIITRPIKGTIRRDPDPCRDQELAEELRRNPKERAENLMIVDLMRNDLGRICRYGSVEVSQLYAVRRYNTLFQMESEVGGRLWPGVGLSRIFAGTFPPGSVTGAPKSEALRIIDSLEPHHRGPYCGAICLIHPNGDFTMSVAIRTGVSRPERTDFCFGSGIVWDSVADAEYEETELKARALTSVVKQETM